MWLAHILALEIPAFEYARGHSEIDCPRSKCRVALRRVPLEANEVPRPVVGPAIAHLLYYGNAVGEEGSPTLTRQPRAAAVWLASRCRPRCRWRHSRRG